MPLTMRGLFFSILFLIVACNKNKDYCWQLYDALGNEAGIVCDKTESEMAAQYGNFYYDRADAKKYCWKIQYQNGPITYADNLSEKMAGIYFQGAILLEKFTCGYCQKWMSREKGLYKPTGNFAYKPAKVEQLCGDTCNTLFPGRIIILRDTPDSLITVEFLQKL